MAAPLYRVGWWRDWTWVEMGADRSVRATWLVWEWSSFRHYSLREVGTVEIESEWTAHDREMLASGGSQGRFSAPGLMATLLTGFRRT